eukprot:1472893-Prymnesium_polylepis.1
MACRLELALRRFASASQEQIDRADAGADPDKEDTFGARVDSARTSLRTIEKAGAWKDYRAYWIKLENFILA